MPELAAPLTQSARASRRLELIERMSAQKARLESDLRQQIAAFASEDTPFGVRAYVCDELALALAESPGTADRLIATCQMYVAHPAVMARVGLPLHEGGWSIRHADALLDAISGLGLAAQVQQQVIDLVAAHPDARTPHQIRKAAHAAVMILDPDGAQRRLAKARKDRRVGADARSDGSGSFWATGTASQVAMVMASIDCLAGPQQPADTRTLDQRRFDAFMDLTCGRTVPGQWQALVIVALETLTGASDQPAEIPGLGLINATEARDLLAHAEIRRAVVDEHGELMSVDSTVHRPDLPEAVCLDPPHPDTGLSLQTEPAPLDTTPEDPPARADTTWLNQQNELDEQVHAVTSTLEAELAALLAAHTPLRAASRSGAGVQEHRPWPRIDIEIDGWRHDPGPDAPGPGGPGPGRPGPVSPGDSRDPDRDRDPNRDPDPPSQDDQLWAEATTDRAAQDALEPPPRYEREPWTPYPRRSESPPPWTSWTRLALTAALTKISTALPQPQALSSTAYALPPRLARFIKHRDIRRNPGSHATPWLVVDSFSMSLRSSAGVRNPCRFRGRALSSAAMLSRSPGP